MTAPANGPVRKKETSAKAVKTPSAVPRFGSGTRFTASTPSAGKTREKPKPARAAAAKAIQGEGASHSSKIPSDSTIRQVMTTGSPPNRLMTWMNRRRATMKATPKAVRHKAAPLQLKRTEKNETKV